MVVHDTWSQLLLDLRTKCRTARAACMQSCLGDEFSSAMTNASRITLHQEAVS